MVAIVVVVAVIGGVAKKGNNEGGGNDLPSMMAGGPQVDDKFDSDKDRPFDALDPNNAEEINKEQISDMYEYMFNKWQPQWFDRSKGWTGQTYSDALFFCAKHSSQIVCPYEAMCPMVCLH